MCKEDIRIARKQSVRASVEFDENTATTTILHPANANRTAIIVALSEYDVFDDRNIGSLGVVTAAGRIPLCTLSGGQPSAVLRIEEYGQILLNPIIWIQGLAITVHTGRITDIELLEPLESV